MGVYRAAGAYNLFHVSVHYYAFTNTPAVNLNGFRAFQPAGLLTEPFSHSDANAAAHISNLYDIHRNVFLFFYFLFCCSVVHWEGARQREYQYLTAIDECRKERAERGCSKVPASVL